jgi:hypothetical protein
VYALEIQLCSDTKNVAKMKTIYPKTLNLSAAVPDPRVMGPICEVMVNEMVEQQHGLNMAEHGSLIN